MIEGARGTILGGAASRRVILCVRYRKAVHKLTADQQKVPDCQTGNLCSLTVDCLALDRSCRPTFMVALSHRPSIAL